MNETTPPSPESPPSPSPELGAEAVRPVGIIGPEWSLRRSARGAALWRHASVLAMSKGPGVELLALDPSSVGPRFLTRDEWNVPAPGTRFRVRRTNAGPRTATFDALDRSRLEGAVLDWVRERRPRLVHVLELEPFGSGVLLALEAAGVPVVLSIDRPDSLLAPGADPAARAQESAALASVRRIIVRSTDAATALETSGAPRSRVRVINAQRGDERTVLRAFASLYQLIAPVSGTATGPAAISNSGPVRAESTPPTAA